MIKLSGSAYNLDKSYFSNDCFLNSKKKIGKTHTELWEETGKSIPLGNNDALELHKLEAERLERYADMTEANAWAILESSPFGHQQFDQLMSSVQQIRKQAEFHRRITNRELSLF